MPKKLSIKTIGIAYNLKRKNTSDDSCEEYDEIETIRAVETEIKRYGFKTVRLEQDGNFFAKLAREKIDFVFNLAEGIGAGRGRESQVPCILESLRMPYSGSDPIALGITLDKCLTNVILRANVIPVPQMYLVNDSRLFPFGNEIFDEGKNFIVKPRWEGSSKGIFLNSVAVDYGSLKKRVGFVIKKYKQPAVIEEFLPGDEITAAVCGNANKSRLLGMMRIAPKEKSPRFFLYSIENKRDWKEKIKYEPPMVIPSPARGLITRYALCAFRALELRDIARIDFRLDQNNIPRIIDITAGIIQNW